MKLRRQSQKRKVVMIVLAIVLAVALIAGIVAIIVGVNNAKKLEAFNKEVVRIIVASKPNKTVYYVGEEFDPTGLRIQVVTNGQDETYFVDYNEEMNIIGFDSSKSASSQVITVSYKGFSSMFVVEIKEEPKPAPTLEKIEVYGFKTTYSLTEWNTYGPDVAGARIRCIYSDESVEEDIILKNSYIKGYQKLDAPGTTEITVKYSVGGKTLETTVTITITN